MIDEALNGEKGYMGTLYTFLEFFCKPKNALVNKVYLKKKKNHTSKFLKGGGVFAPSASDSVPIDQTLLLQGLNEITKSTQNSICYTESA